MFLSRNSRYIFEFNIKISLAWRCWRSCSFYDSGPCFDEAGVVFFRQVEPLQEDVVLQEPVEEAGGKWQLVYSL